MLIHVDCFKESGKWYAGDYVHISGKYQLWDEGLKAEIIANQNFLAPEAFKNYTVVLDDRDHNSDPNYQGFYTHLFPVGSFK